MTKYLTTSVAGKDRNFPRGTLHSPSRRGLRVLWRGVLLLTTLLVACSAHDATWDGGGESSSDLYGAQKLKFSLPNGVALAQVALLASGSVKIGDRAKIADPASGFASIANTGPSETTLGAESSTGNIWSQGSV